MLWVLLVCLFGFVLSFSISTFLHFGPDFSLLIGSLVAEALLVATFSCPDRQEIHEKRVVEHFLF